MHTRGALAWVLRTGGLLAVGGILAACSNAATSVAPPAAPTAAAPPEATVPPEPSGDPVRGGLLYDTWWVVLASEQEGGDGQEAQGPSNDHPLWSTQSTNTRTGSDT